MTKWVYIVEMHTHKRWLHAYLLYVYLKAHLLLILTLLFNNKVCSARQWASYKRAFLTKQSDEDLQNENLLLQSSAKVAYWTRKMELCTFWTLTVFCVLMWCNLDTDWMSPGCLYGLPIGVRYCRLWIYMIWGCMEHDYKTTYVPVFNYY